MVCNGCHHNQLELGKVEQNLDFSEKITFIRYKKKQKTQNHYYSKNSKSKIRNYYENNKESSQKQAQISYKNLSAEKKDKKENTE